MTSQKNVENEIKIIPTTETQLKLKASIRSGSSGAVQKSLSNTLGLAGCEIIATGVDSILDEYWDTPKLDLFHSKRIFRIRKDSKGTTIYIKNEGERKDGVFRRDEMKIPMNGDALLDGIYSSFSSTQKELLPELSERIERTLKVDNQRYAFLLKRRHEEYELTLDIFSFISEKYTRASRQQMEIEVEALNPEGVNHIADLSTVIRAHMANAKISIDSKYERGIKTLHLAWPSIVQQLLAIPDSVVVKLALILMAIAGFCISLASLF